FAAGSRAAWSRSSSTSAYGPEPTGSEPNGSSAISPGGTSPRRRGRSLAGRYLPERVGRRDRLGRQDDEPGDRIREVEANGQRIDGRGRDPRPRSGAGPVVVGIREGRPRAGDMRRG